MASGNDPHIVDEQGPHEFPGEGEPIGGFEEGDAHGHHGHDDHHGDHATGGDAWVLVPIAVGLVIGLVLALIFGLASGFASLV